MTSLKKPPRRFRIIVAENAHYQDPEHEYEVEGADTAAEAVAKCKEIVDQSLHGLAGPDRSASEIIADYRLYGDDPYILSPRGEDVTFSAWTYAEERAGAYVQPEQD